MDCAVRQDWEIVADGTLEDGTETMWIRNIANSNEFYLIEELVNGTFNVLNQNEEVLCNYKTLQGAKRWVGTRINRRELMEVARNVDEKEHESILALCKKLYPRRKYLAYRLRKKNETDVARYVIKYNLTMEEYKAICKIWEHSKDNNYKENQNVYIFK